MSKLISAIFLIGISLAASCGHQYTNGRSDIAESESPILYTWVVHGPGGNVIARAITGDNECPEINFLFSDMPDGVNKKETAQRMDIRAEYGLYKDFPITVCEAIVPSEAEKALIEKIDLPLPIENPKRIVIIGDTGCRLKAKDNVYQACNDPDAWPFRKIAESVAAWGPELIIHVGDYFYRENECPVGNSGCEGSPYGDNWDAWDADFFGPGEPLLTAAPLIMIRGNHERCQRGGKGWFLTLDTTLETPLKSDICEDFSKPFAVNIGELDIFNMDTAVSLDAEAPPELVTEYASQFKELNEINSEKAWLLLHHPMWGIRYGDRPDTDPKCCTSLTLQTASKNNFPESVDLIVSGHIHMFQYLNFNRGTSESGSIPSQLISGGGGVLLYTKPSGSIAGRSVGGMTIQKGDAIPEFSFTTVEFLDDGSVQFKMRGIDGNEINKCELIGENFSCEN